MVAALFASKALVGAQQFVPRQHTGPVQVHRLVEPDLQKNAQKKNNITEQTSGRCLADVAGYIRQTST